MIPHTRNSTLSFVVLSQMHDTIDVKDESCFYERVKRQRPMWRKKNAPALSRVRMLVV